MTFELVPTSQWHDALIPVFFLLWLFALVAICFGVREERPVLSWLWYGMAISLACVFLGLIFWGFESKNQESRQNDAKFSQQLMTEYHVKSSLPLSQIDPMLRDSNNATTVFISPDGTETAVSVRVVNRTDREITMTFTMVDNNEPYPQPSKYE